MSFDTPQVGRVTPCAPRLTAEGGRSDAPYLA